MTAAALPWVAGLLAASAVLAWRPPAAWVVAVRLGGTRRRSPAAGSWRPSCGWPAVVALVAAPWVVAGPVSVLLLATAAGVGTAVVAAVRRGRRRARADDLAVRIADGVDALATELRAGGLASTALASVAEDLPELRPVVLAAERGADVPAALRAASARPGGHDLVQVAAAWQVAERSGAPVAAVLERVADAVRADRELAREVRSECAAARATSRLLAVLPLLGLGLGAGLGGDPVHVLTATLPGAACLAAGSALAVLGLLWVERIVAGAERAA